MEVYSFCFKLFIYIYFWLFWVFAAACELSLVQRVGATL